MNATLKELLPVIEDWPDEDQATLAQYALEIEARRAGRYVLNDEERTAVREGLAQAERGEFVPDERIAAMWKRFGVT